MAGEDQRDRFITDPEMTDDEVRELAADVFSDDDMAPQMAEWLVSLKQHQREDVRRADLLARHDIESLGTATQERVKGYDPGRMKAEFMNAMERACVTEPLLIDSTDDTRELCRITINTERMAECAIEGEVLPWPKCLGHFTTQAPYFAVLSTDGSSTGDAELWGTTPFAFKSDDIGEDSPVRPIRITLEGLEEHREFLYEYGMDLDHLWAYEVNGRLITYGDLIMAIFYKSTSLAIVTDLEEKEYRASLPRQDTTTLVRQFDPDSIVAKTLFSPKSAELFPGDDYDAALLPVESAAERRRGKVVEVEVSFSTANGPKLSREISAFDRSVHRAISSHWAAGNRYVSLRDIAKATYGRDNPSKAQIERVRESIELQMSIKGTIDFTEEMRGRPVEIDGESYSPRLTGYIINGDKLDLVAPNGRIIDGYVLHREPMLYLHSRALGQIVSYPSRFLRLGNGSDTEANVTIRDQILRQVENIKNASKRKHSKLSNNIRFLADPVHPDRQYLFARAGVDETDRHRRAEATEFALSVLDGLKKDPDGIKGYRRLTVTRGGHRIVYGVTITP